MGNLTSSMIYVYHLVEAMPVSLTPIGLVSVFLVYVACCLCRVWCCGKKNCEDFWEKFFGTLESCIVVIYSQTIKRVRTFQVRRRLPWRAQEKWNTGEQNSLLLSETNSKETVLFAGFELEDDDTCCCNCCNSKRWTISYFVVMFFWAVWLGIVVFWDTFIYSKLTRCIDINTRDDTITCFYVANNTQASCLEISERGQTADVICYALKVNIFGALGVASGFVMVVILFIQIAFIILLYIGRCCCESVCCVIVLQSSAVFTIVLVAILFPVLSLLGSDTRSNPGNFFYANLPLRWVQFVLLVLSGICFAILVPSYRFVDSSRSSHYTDVLVLDKASEEKRELSINCMD